ncbi:MAG: lamin tail domain-containing protein, partial [Chloroflexota bacterium]|nr:lamin tail domain-containing protein [Chloroflexota bacterium]
SLLQSRRWPVVSNPRLWRGLPPPGPRAKLDGGTWISFAAATPGAANEPCGRMPVISKVGHTPPVPSATDQVTVTAVVVGDDASAVIPATLWYNVGSGFLATPMTHVGDNLYAATIPAQPDGTRVAYYIRVASGQGLSATAPPEAQVDAYRYLVGYRPPPLFISEFMADNVTVLEDPDAPGRFPDWIELHNPSPAPVDLGGKYLTDDLADPTKFRISDNLIIPGGGFVLFYADNDPEQGPFHTNFRLSGDGESIGLFDSDVTGNQPIHTYTFGLQVADMSERRYSNGGDTWVTFRVPTPGWADVPGQMPYMPMVLK